MDNLETKIFLHACCGPCAEWPVSELRNEKLEPVIYYYNPNIHPHFEWERRLENVKKLGEIKAVGVLFEKDYREEKWTGQAWLGRYETRCHMCYDMRMQKVAEEAKARGFSIFTTTLLVSIYQNHEAVREAALRAADRVGVQFLYRDFRDGYRKGQQMAREDGLYRQKYCGCILSLEESDFRDKIYAGFEGNNG